MTELRENLTPLSREWFKNLFELVESEGRGIPGFTPKQAMAELEPHLALIAGGSDERAHDDRAAHDTVLQLTPWRLPDTHPETEGGASYDHIFPVRVRNDAFGDPSVRALMADSPDWWSVATIDADGQWLVAAPTWDDEWRQAHAQCVVTGWCYPDELAIAGAVPGGSGEVSEEAVEAANAAMLRVVVEQGLPPDATWPPKDAGEDELAKARLGMKAALSAAYAIDRPAPSRLEDYRRRVAELEARDDRRVKSSVDDVMEIAALKRERDAMRGVVSAARVFKVKHPAARQAISPARANLDAALARLDALTKASVTPR